MKRLFIVAAAAWLMLAGSAVRAQDSTVNYLDPTTKKDDSVVGVIQEETPVGITVRKGAKTTTVPALAITQVTYFHPTIKPLEFRTPFTLETNALRKTKKEDQKTGLTNALKEFELLAPKLKDTPNAYRYFLFKIAQVKARLAQLDGEAKAMKVAVDALNEFRDGYATSWQIVPALKLLADLHEQQGDLDAARAAYEKLLTVPDLPREVKDKSDLMIAQMLVRGKRYTEAETRLESLFKSMPADDPQRGFIQVYLVEAQMAQNKLGEVEAKLKAVLASAGETSLKASAHNLMGDYYRQKNQDEAAFWHYLRVDALYAQDRDQHARAMYQLMKLFESLYGNRVRAQQYYEKLTDKSLAGSEYYRKAAAEKPPLSTEK